MLKTILFFYVHAILPLSFLAALAASRWASSTGKRAAWAFLIAALGQKLVQGTGQTMYGSFEPGVALLDLGLFITFLSLSFREPTTWLLTATAFQLLSTWAHVVRLVDISMSALAYAILMGTGGYPILILIGAGTIAEMRERMRMQPNGVTV